jgi:hypothetical protein
MVPYARENPITKKPDIYQIKMIGDYKEDFNAANNLAGYESTPDGYIWHHHQDRKTMILVPKDINKFPHTGGVSVIAELKKLP